MPDDPHADAKRTTGDSSHRPISRAPNGVRCDSPFHGQPDHNICWYVEGESFECEPGCPACNKGPKPGQPLSIE